MIHTSEIYKTDCNFPAALISALLCLLLAACNTPNNPFANTSDSQVASNNNITGPGIQGVQLFVEPTAGDQVIINAITSAKRSIWLEIYLLTDKKIISALEDAAHNHIDVRVMLEPHPYGSGSLAPRKTIDKLKAAGVQAQASSPDFALTHEKGMLIDDSIAYIMTCNFTTSALGGTKNTSNREYGIIDTNAQDIQAIRSIFNADWQHSNAQFNDANLVVSPENSRNTFTNLINSAEKTLSIEAEEMQDDGIEQALINAVKRGIQVQVILPAPAAASTDSNSPGIATIKQGGVQVKEDSTLYMHAKIILVDGHKAFVGSENISTASLKKNRELGILVSDINVLQTLQQTFQQDWNTSKLSSINIIKRIVSI